jgi:hypothetical protein
MNIQEKISKKKQELEALEKQFKKQQEKVEWMKVKAPFGDFEIQCKLTHLSENRKTTLKKIKEESHLCICGHTHVGLKGHKEKCINCKCKSFENNELDIATYEQLQYCRNNNLHKCFIEFWARLKENPNKVDEKNGYEARFDANSGRAYLYCNSSPSSTYSSLGVFVVRKKIRGLSMDNKRMKREEQGIEINIQKAGICKKALKKMRWLKRLLIQKLEKMAI